MWRPGGWEWKQIWRPQDDGSESRCEDQGGGAGVDGGRMRFKCLYHEKYDIHNIKFVILNKDIF